MTTMDELAEREKNAQRYLSSLKDARSRAEDSYRMLGEAIDPVTQAIGSAYLAALNGAVKQAATRLAVVSAECTAAWEAGQR
jgi:hypothetical protein